MSPVLWNITIVWSACAVLAVEYGAILLEQERQRQPQRQRPQIEPKTGNEDGGGD